MSLYVANPTLQQAHFHFRVPGQPKVRQVIIEAGRQICLEKLDDDAVKFVIEQLKRAGGIPTGDPAAIKERFTLLYSDRPISTDGLDEAREQDWEVRQDKAEAALEASGQALNAAVDDKSHGRVTATTLEVQQVEDTGGVRSDGSAITKPVRGGVSTEIKVSKKAGRRRVEPRH